MDLLDPSALLHHLPSLLPPSSTTLHHPCDALAIMIHTIMSRLDFRLVGLSDSDQLIPSSSSDDDGNHSNRLPELWNSRAPESYSFRYKHNQSSLDFLVKVVKLGGKAVIHGIALQGSTTSTLELIIQDYFSQSFFPYTLDTPNAEPLVNGFISSSRLKDLIVSYKIQILQKLVPSLRKEGYQEEESTSQGQPTTSFSESNRSQQQQQQPSRRQPLPPIFGEPDDPSSVREMNSSSRYRNPFTIGDRDLDPLGGASIQVPPPFGGSTNPSHPPPLFPGRDNGGGMYLGPNHPMFRDRFQRGDSFGPTGEILPPDVRPPGARWDPIHPFGITPGGGGGGREPDVGGPLPQIPSRSNPASGNPDWDELAPPGIHQTRPSGGGGYNDMFS